MNIKFVIFDLDGVLVAGNYCIGKHEIILHSLM